MSMAAPQVGPMLFAGRLLVAVVVLCLSLQINLAESKASECCAAGDQTLFCKAFSSLNSMEQQELRILLGNKCDESAQSMTMEKRKPNFIRFGRSLGNSMHGSDPNFLRFGRSSPMIVEMRSEQLGDGEAIPVKCQRQFPPIWQIF
uniref:Uncharacterized protein n=1 Tax=Ditylenchus dipsaci TaxID=166011 RepID=A0A915D3N6_9BILA